MAEEKTTAKRGRPSTKTNANENINNDTVELIKQMQEQIASLQKQLDNEKSNNANQVVVQSNSDMTRTIKVISMLPNTYVLRVRKDAKEKGKTYIFDHFGSVQNIRFTDMVEIINNYPTQFERGWAILTNKKDYDDLGYGYIYDNVMDLDAINELIKLQNMDSVDAILDMDEDTAEKIVALIAQKMSEGYSYDFNMIEALKQEGYDVVAIKDLVSAK